MGKLSTHVLDTTQGRPASGVRVDLYAIENDQRTLIKTTHTNSDGRCDEPLLQGQAMHTGVFELVFHAGDYFAATRFSLLPTGKQSFRRRRNLFEGLSLIFFN